jgi:hypothetical protein
MIYIRKITSSQIRSNPSKYFDLKKNVKGILNFY